MRAKLSGMKMRPVRACALPSASTVAHRAYLYIIAAVNECRRRKSISSRTRRLHQGVKETVAKSLDVSLNIAAIDDTFERRWLQSALSKRAIIGAGGFVAGGWAGRLGVAGRI